MNLKNVIIKKHKLEVNPRFVEEIPVRTEVVRIDFQVFQMRYWLPWKINLMDFEETCLISNLQHQWRRLMEYDQQVNLID